MLRSPKFLVLLTAAFAVVGLPTLQATEDVTSMNTTFSNGVSSPADGYIYEGSQRSLNGFSTATANYGVASLANNVFVRRNTVVADQSSTWYVSSGVGTNLSGVHSDSYSSLLMSNSSLSGSDNTFANAGNPGQFGSVERIDFTWNSGLTVTNSLAFAVFDRGAAAAHDGFGIAAITAIDGSGNPTAFGSLLKVAPGWGGAVNPMADQSYRLFRYGNGDNISVSNDSSGTNAQGVGGISISAVDLGLTNGTRVYGYALTGYDVTATNSIQLLDYSNSAYYPTDTDTGGTGGGIDLASFNGVEFAALVVPEPGTFSAILLGGAFVASFHYLSARRRRIAK